MKKPLILVFLLIVIFSPLSVMSAFDETIVYDNSDIVDAANSSNFIADAAPDFSFDETVKRITRGENIFDFHSALIWFLKMFSAELYENIKIMLAVIFVAIISGLISNLQTSYNSKAVSEIAFLAFFTVVVGLTVNGLSGSFTLVTETVSDQVLFMKTAVPVYIALVASSGNPAAAVGMEPVFLYFIQLIGSLMEKIILPTIFWIAVLNMVNCLNEKYGITKLIDFVKQIIRWGLGILMTFFVSILGMSGVTATITNNLGIKTMKYAIGNFVPVVGGLLSDSIDTVLSSASVLKGAMGMAGVITIVLMCATPLIKMLSFIFVYKLTAGLIEPLADSRITAVISEAGSSASFAFTILISVAIMFVLGITITVNISGRI